MRNLLSLFFVASAVYAQTPTVTSVTYDSLSHSVIRIDFNTSAGFVEGHIRYIDTTANPSGVCTDGVSGIVQANAYHGSSNTPQATYGSYQMSLGGLTPGHTYSFCPEINSVQGGAFTTGGPSLSVTMPGIPAMHPALPVPPATFPTGYPSDMASYTSMTMGSDCANLVSCLGTAINNQLLHGTIISLPAGVPASSIGGIGPFGGEGVFPVAPDVVNFTSSAVSTTANTITSTAHGFTEGSRVVFGVSYGCLPGDYTANPSACKTAGNNNRIPFPRNVPLQVHVIDANTFQVYTCPGQPTNGSGPGCTFANGALLTFADAGNGTMRYAKFPRALHWIIVRTSTPDSQFVPLGSSLQGPPDGTGVPTRPAQWAAKMGNLQVPVGAAALIVIGDFNTEPLDANIRFVGLHFSYTDTSETYLSSDPTPGGALAVTALDTGNIFWDRCYFDAPETPFRTGIVWNWNGLNNGWFGNYMAGLEGWHQTTSGLGVSGSGTTATIGSGTTVFGAGAGTLASNATISLSGTSPTGTAHRMFLDFSMTGGTLNIAAPPGVTPTVSGIGNYHMVNLSASGPTLNSVGATSLAVPPNRGKDNYYADPVVSTSAACTGTVTLFAGLNVNTLPSFAVVPPGGNFGIQFISDANQYLCGVRLYKHPSDNETTHTVGAWDASGAQLATASTSAESASGWQTALFSSPVAISAGTKYQVGYHTTYGWPYTSAQFRNTDYAANNMHIVGGYVDSNGNGGYGDSWPLDYLGNPSVGILGFVDIAAAGTISGVGNTSNSSTHNAAYGNGIVAGFGPGPWMAIGNFISGAGLPWHFDNSGYRWAMRGDYTLIRNYHYGPRYTLFTTSTSNGMDYTWRQPLEWKGGNRIRIYGDIFDGSMKEGGSIAMIALQTPGEVNCVTDADVMFNTFKHGPGTLSGGIEYGRGSPMACPPVRTRYAQNVSWDIAGTYAVGGSSTGWWLSGQIGAEDIIVDHNTDIGRSGGKPAWWDQPTEFKMEGVQVTNNFLQVDPAFGGLEEDSSGIPGDTCAGLVGKAMADCKWTPSYVMDHNVLLPSFGATQSRVQAFFPSPLVNYIPSNGSITAQGLFRSQAGYSLSTPDPDLHLNSIASNCSGCGKPAGDVGDVGANIDLLQANQGFVTVSGYGPSGSTTGFVTVDQPDTYTCTLEYGADATFTAGTNTRITQSCTPGPVTFNLTGLTSKTVVHWKFYGAVQEPERQFRTN